MRNLIFFVFLLVLMSSVPLVAQTTRDRVVRELNTLGFDVVSDRKTLLGRIQIIADRDGLRREIVLNPRTGEILRDYSKLPPEKAVSGDRRSAPGIVNKAQHPVLAGFVGNLFDRREDGSSVSADKGGRDDRAGKKDPPQTDKSSTPEKSHGSSKSRSFAKLGSDDKKRSGRDRPEESRGKKGRNKTDKKHDEKKGKSRPDGKSHKGGKKSK